MEIKIDRLIDFLRVVDKELEREIQLNAVGGTAMTLLGLKTSTIDIDFDLSETDAVEFERVLRIIPHGYRIDRFVNGNIFSQDLPQDYVSKLIPVKTDLTKIRLCALHPIDIVVTKIGRLNERDIQDIESCIKDYGLDKKSITARAHQVACPGNEDIYEKNLQYVIKKFF